MNPSLMLILIILVILTLIEQLIQLFIIMGKILSKSWPRSKDRKTFTEYYLDDTNISSLETNQSSEFTVISTNKGQRNSLYFAT